jgi:hypothetical protein
VNDAGAEAINVLRSELPEEIMNSQYGALVGASVRREGFGTNRHVIDSPTSPCSGSSRPISAPAPTAMAAA